MTEDWPIEAFVDHNLAVLAVFYEMSDSPVDITMYVCDFCGGVMAVKTDEEDEDEFLCCDCDGGMRLSQHIKEYQEC